jgi:uncharacterized membrane protein YdjX (TVP38/TMEM64 family)
VVGGVNAIDCLDEQFRTRSGAGHAMAIRANVLPMPEVREQNDAGLTGATGSAPAPLAQQVGRVWRQLGPAGVLGVMWSILPAVCGILLLRYLEVVSKWLQAQGETRAVLIYVGAFVLSAGLGLMPTYAQAVLAGWCFKVPVGFPAALMGFAGAAAIGYATARTVASDRVEALLKENPRAEVVRQALVGRGFLHTLGIVTLVRLPSSPFALTNLAMASAGVPFGPYLLGTLIGMAPRTFLGVLLGSSAQELTTERPRWLVFGSVGAALVVVAIIGTIAKQALAKFTGEKGGTGPVSDRV